MNREQREQRKGGTLLIHPSCLIWLQASGSFLVGVQHRCLQALGCSSWAGCGKGIIVEALSFNDMVLNWEPRRSELSHYLPSMKLVSFPFLALPLAECPRHVGAVSGTPCSHYLVCKLGTGGPESRFSLSPSCVLGFQVQVFRSEEKLRVLVLWEWGMGCL